MVAKNEANQPVVVIPNWNGVDHLKDCLDSLQNQILKPYIVVIDNGSVDDSVALIEQSYPSVELIKHSKNKGYAGGVNPGFKRAIEKGAKYVAAFNNDAVADKYWLKRLVACLDDNPKVGAAACKLLSFDGHRIDSTGEFYTSWGLPYSRGRGEPSDTFFDSKTPIFAASGGASLYRTEMLKQVGLLDEDFFAYYEDVDLGFRGQLYGWKVAYVADAEVNHSTGSTSAKIPGFVTFQAHKNLPWLLIKNMPLKHFWPVYWRFSLAYVGFMVSAIARGQGWPAIKGGFYSLLLLPKKLIERRRIQKSRTVSDDYIWASLVHDLPPKAYQLRKLRGFVSGRFRNNG